MMRPSCVHGTHLTITRTASLTRASCGFLTMRIVRGRRERVWALGELDGAGDEAGEDEKEG